jgi:hypothetical protein
MAVPVPRTYVASEFVTATILNADIRDVNNFQLEPPRCFAYRNADKSTSNGVTTVYDMDLELFDSHTAHSLVTNNSRLIAPEPGIYLALCQAKWAANATGSRRIQLRKNAAGNPVSGTLVFDTANLPSSGNIGFAHGSVHVQLSSGDYIEMFTEQTSGGALNVIGGPGESYLSFMWAAKL